MTTKWTKGPWTASTYLDRDGEWGIIDNEDTIIVGVSSRITEANAQLMASAPVLYESLEAITRFVDERCAATFENGTLIGKANRALRQARGEGK